MDAIVGWLLGGDVSVQYLTHRDLLHSDPAVLVQLQQRIHREGFGARLLACRNADGHWGSHYYQPKWTSTHYSLCDLRNLGIDKETEACRMMVLRALDECQLENGGLDFSRSHRPSDVAIDGMFLDYASYFCGTDERLQSLVDFMIAQQKPDGGFSWDYGTSTGDPHTTICVLEGLHAYSQESHAKDPEMIAQRITRGVQFFIDHQLFLDGDVRYRKLTYPHRYRYDLLRFLNFIASSHVKADQHLEKAFGWLARKRTDTGWNLEHIHPGAVHLQFERKGEPSRFITLKALWILAYASQDRISAIGGKDRQAKAWTQG